MSAPPLPFPTSSPSSSSSSTSFPTSPPFRLPFPTLLSVLLCSSVPPSSPSFPSIDILSQLNDSLLSSPSNISIAIQSGLQSHIFAILKHFSPTAQSTPWLITILKSLLSDSSCRESFIFAFSSLSSFLSLFSATPSSSSAPSLFISLISMLSSLIDHYDMRNHMKSVITDRESLIQFLCSQIEFEGSPLKSNLNKKIEKNKKSNETKENELDDNNNDNDIEIDFDDFNRRLSAIELLNKLLSVCLPFPSSSSSPPIPHSTIHSLSRILHILSSPLSLSSSTMHRHTLSTLSLSSLLSSYSQYHNIFNVDSNCTKAILTIFHHSLAHIVTHSFNTIGEITVGTISNSTINNIQWRKWVEILLGSGNVLLTLVGGSTKSISICLDFHDHTSPFLNSLMEFIISYDDRYLHPLSMSAMPAMFRKTSMMAITTNKNSNNNKKGKGKDTIDIPSPLQSMYSLFTSLFLSLSSISSSLKSVSPLFIQRPLITISTFSLTKYHQALSHQTQQTWEEIQNLQQKYQSLQSPPSYVKGVRNLLSIIYVMEGIKCLVDWGGDKDKENDKYEWKEVEFNIEIPMGGRGLSPSLSDCPLGVYLTYSIDNMMEMLQFFVDVFEDFTIQKKSKEITKKIHKFIAI